MSPMGLGIFVFFAFLVPVPLLHWLDLPRRLGDSALNSEDSE